jgi:hypothetical protein
MAGPEATDRLARIARELEPLQRAGQRLQHGIEQFSKVCGAAREAWRPHFEVWRRFVAARDRGDFRDFQTRLRLTAWIAQQFNNAKDNPSHKNARVWLMMGHLTPKQIAVLLPHLQMDMGDLRVPMRRGRPRRPAANTPKMVERLDRRIKRTGERPTAAARALLTEHGFHASTLKAAADHLVRVWKKRVLKSR